MPLLKVNDGIINYAQIECESKGACQDLVMIHGLATSMAFWYYPHAVNFSKHYRITLYDLRGHGRSQATPRGYTPRDMSLDLQALLDHLGIGRAHFIAHSFGGVVALNLACLDPDRFSSLVLVDTHISASRQRSEANSWVFGEKIQPILDRHGMKVDTNEPYFGYKLMTEVARLYRQNSEIPEVFQRVVSPIIGTFRKRTATQWLDLLDTTRAEEELMGDDGLTAGKLEALDFPILAIYGEHSQAMSTGGQLLGVWPHAQFRRVRDVGHFFPLTRPREFMETCLHFWNTAPPAGPPGREGEANGSYFRSTRFYRRGGNWYFDTREAKAVGPFESIDQAKIGLWALLPTPHAVELQVR